MLLVVLMLIAVLVADTMITGLCRPCHNDGVEKKMYRLTVPELWECRKCQKENEDG